MIRMLVHPDKDHGLLEILWRERAFCCIVLDPCQPELVVKDVRWASGVYFRKYCCQPIQPRATATVTAATAAAAAAAASGTFAVACA